MRNQQTDDPLKQMASKYIWWKTPDKALAMPERIIAQVMNIGEYSDVQRLADELGEEAFRSALSHAECGQFSARSWTYWHHRLNLSGIDDVPPLPERIFSNNQS